MNYIGPHMGRLGFIQGVWTMAGIGSSSELLPSGRGEVQRGGLVYATSRARLLRLYVRVCIYICIYIHTCVHLCLPTYVYMHVHTPIHTCIRISTYMYMYAYTTTSQRLVLCFFLPFLLRRCRRLSRTSFSKLKKSCCARLVFRA